MKEVARMTQKESLSNRLGESIDKLVSIFSPKWAMVRRGYREGFGGYSGAKKDRTRSSWNVFGNSPDEDILHDLPNLRNRSRDLNRNDPHASGITQTVTINTIGSGITPQSRLDKTALGLTDDQSSQYRKELEKIWKKWVPYADIGTRMDFYEIQSLVDRKILEDGECFVLFLRSDNVNRPYSLAVQVIEADRIATPPELQSNKNIRDGIELGENGEPVAYYVCKSHPGDLVYGKPEERLMFQRIEAFNRFGQKNILHLYQVLRPGQTRGVPFFAPVLTYFLHKSAYMEAELVKARLTACICMVIKRLEPYQASISASSKTDSENNRIEELSPGKVIYLTPEEDMATFAPQNNGNTTYGIYMENVLRSISASLNLCYEIVAKDFSKTNYSSARASLLEARRYFRIRQKWIARKLCQPTWELLIEEAYLRGDIDLPQFYERKFDWLSAEWIGEGWEWVDPEKEVKALNLSLETGIATYSDICANQGKDWEEQFEQRKREQDKAEELGINIQVNNKQETQQAGSENGSQQSGTQ